MPIFEYQCTRCKAEFEKLVFAADQDEIQCPECQSKEVVKKMSAASITGSDKCGPAGGAGNFS